MKPITVSCSKCMARFDIDDESLLGQDCECPTCGNSIYIPLPEPEIETFTKTNQHLDKKCQFCGELIKKEAIKCKHCGEFLKSNTNSGKKEKAQVIELTSKKYKRDILKYTIVLIAGIAIFSIGRLLIGVENQIIDFVGLFFIVLGGIIALIAIIYLLITKFNIWWNHE